MKRKAGVTMASAIPMNQRSVATPPKLVQTTNSMTPIPLRAGCDQFGSVLARTTEASLGSPEQVACGDHIAHIILLYQKVARILCEEVTHVKHCGERRIADRSVSHDKYEWQPFRSLCASKMKIISKVKKNAKRERLLVNELQTI